MDKHSSLHISEQVFARLGKELSITTSAAAAAEIILKAADELIGWDACYLILYDPESGERPRPLMTVDTTISNQRVILKDAAPAKPSENMLRAIREDGLIFLHEHAYELDPSQTFGDRSRRTLSQLFVPVRTGKRTIGVLSIQSYQLKKYNLDSLETLKALSNHCAGALERIWAQEALSEMVERLKILYQTAHSISASLDVEQLYDAIHATVEKVMPCDDFVIDGYDKATNEIVPIYAVEYPHKRVYTARYYADHGLAGKVVHTQKSVLLNSIEELNSSGIDFETYGSAPVDPTQSIVAVPMILHGEVVGMVSAQSYRPNAYTRDDQYLLELLAAHAAIAIENARLFATVQNLANTDSLTGVYNRRKFYEVAELELYRVIRHEHPLSVIMLDVDEFKKFNDLFGHKVGDLVLKLVAEQCKTSLRGMDIMGRLGGEEFAIILPETTPEEAILVAHRLSKMIETIDLGEAKKLFEQSTGSTSADEALRITVSMGVASCQHDCISIDVLLDHADRAMYSAKYSGRNRITVWSPEISPEEQK